MYLKQEQEAMAEADGRFRSKCLVTLQKAFTSWKQATVVFREERVLNQVATKHRNNVVTRTYIAK